MILSLGWVYPVIAFAPNTKSIPTWRDNYVFEIPPKQLNESYSKEYVEDLIRLKAKNAGLDVDLMARIAYCESGFQQKWNYAHESNPNYYTAFGVFQIIKSHELKYGISRLTLEGNIDLAFSLYKDGGLEHWKLSMGCIRII